MHHFTPIGILFLCFILGLIITIIYYISSSKRRRKAFYHKDEKGWQNSLPEASQQLVYTTFLIGDAGAPNLLRPELNLEILKAQLLEAGSNSAVFFLGDNIYPRGMPLPTDPSHQQAEKRLLGQLTILKDYKGRICFISGNHDWNKGRRGGYEAMLRQQAYVDAYFGREDIYLPRNGCVGPVELPLAEGITAIIINTQWWVHSSKKPEGKKDGCLTENEEEFFEKLDALLQKNKDNKLLVIGHHPVYSYAYHGGKFNMKQHLFPLTEVNKKLYIPFPIIGSIYPIYRKYIGSREDMAHPLYRNLRTRLIAIFQNYDDLIYASGHDHNLQYIKKLNQHYVISGGGCRVNFVRKGKDAYFTHAHKGFFRLDYYNNGDVWMEAWEPDEEGGKAVLAYRKEIHDNDIGLYSAPEL